MSQVYRFRSKNGVEMKIELSPCEFERRVKNGKIKMPNRMFGGSTTYMLVGDSAPVTNGCYSACWPMQSYNLAVHTSQCEAAEAEARRIGVPTEFSRKTGCPIFNSNQHRTRYAEANSYFEVCASGPSGPKRLDEREREIRAMAGKSVRKCDDQ